MQVKDYYRILELPPSATHAEIKQAYRRLAQQFHPDKHSGDPYSSAQFNEIKEAYEVLSNPAKKEYYLQQRWYHQSAGRRKFRDPVTPVSVLKQAIELERYVASLDIHRMDKDGLYFYITDILSDEVLEKLTRFDEKGINKQIAQLLLAATRHLPLHLADKVAERLSRLPAGPEIQGEIDRSRKQHRREARWEKYKIWLVLLVVLLLSLLILFVS